MTAFWTRLKTIPRPAWIVGILLAASMSTILVLGPMRMEPEIRAWPSFAKLGLLSAMTLLFLGYSLLVGFIYADARRRQMRHVMWAWLALIPYFLGVILYFILRTPLPTPCPSCGTDVAQAYAFCPGCGTAVHPSCTQCGRSLQAEWANCPYCGARTTAA